MEQPSTLFGLSSQNFCLEKFLLFFPKTTCSEKVCYIFSKKAFLIFRKLNFSNISGKIYSDPWHSGTFLHFRKGIIRTLAYLEQEAYSEPWYIKNSGIMELS